MPQEAEANLTIAIPQQTWRWRLALSSPGSEALGKVRGPIALLLPLKVMPESVP